MLHLPTNLNFDNKYKTILKFPYDRSQYYEMVEWVDKNSSEYVDIKVTMLPGEDFASAFFAFENSDDALLFKIKYSNVYKYPNR